jgi:hypothetical protein
MAIWLEELGEHLYAEGERAPQPGFYDLVDENGEKQDALAPILLTKNAIFPEVPQDGLFYLFAGPPEK